MTNLTGAERARYVQQMFSRIARRYDLMNRVMTAGQDIRWRKAVIRLAELPAGGWLLDLGAGTGDLAPRSITPTALRSGRGGRFHPGNDARGAGTQPAPTFTRRSIGLVSRRCHPAAIPRADFRRRWYPAFCCATSTT